MITAPDSSHAEHAGHAPVLLEAVIARLAIAPGDQVVDGTFGAGGYSRAVLEAGADVLAIDRDPDATDRAVPLLSAFGSRFRFVQGRFSCLDELAHASGWTTADGVVLDVGVSSMQLDDPARGFSFQRDGPLDMRMGSDGATAADIVNRAPVDELSALIRAFGEERHAGRIARAIVTARRETAIATTKQLADLVERAAPARGPRRIHPATRTFQALRIFVNRELDELAEGLAAAERLLAAGGRLVVVAFHSLEDRIVKRFLRLRSEDGGGSRHAPPVAVQAPTFLVPRRQPVEPTENEAAANPRSRSARLRHATRTEAEPRALDFAALGIPAIPGVFGPEAYA